MRVGVYHPLSGVTLIAMPIVLFGMRLLEVLFFIGIAGSAIVVVMATWEDIQEISHKTEHGHTVEKTPVT